MAEPYIGEIRMVAFNFAPRSWAQCDGQLLPINQNQALFSILGTTYGGDGRTTFALPDMRGRIPMHRRSGVVGLPDRPLGHKSGQETVSLTVQEMPGHNHTVQATNDNTDIVNDMTGAVLAQAPAGSNPYASTAGGAEMRDGTLGTTGSGQGHQNMSPWLAINYVIAITGIFPPRN